MNFAWDIRGFWMNIPEWLAKALRDAAIGAFSAIVVLNLGIPGSLDEAKAEALLALSAATPAILAVLRVQVVPRIVAWVLGLDEPA